MAAMGRLRSWKRELFARAIAEGVEPKKAYVDAGFKPSSVAFRNYNRLLKQSDVIGRINEFAKEREDRARAARMPASEVLAVFKDCGVEQLEEFFERDAAGIVRVRDLRRVPVEAALAFLRFLREGLRIDGKLP
jgi:hypothetical protein